MKFFALIRNLIYLSGLGGKHKMLVAGDPAPEFTVRSHEGTDIRLADYRGRNVVLWFYPKADTPG